MKFGEDPKILIVLKKVETEKIFAAVALTQSLLPRSLLSEASGASRPDSGSVQDWPPSERAGTAGGSLFVVLCCRNSRN